VKRDADVRLEYELDPIVMIAPSQLQAIHSALGMAQPELHRTHWAVKEVNIDAVASKLGISASGPPRANIDIGQHRFAVALSFPGEKRSIVRPVADRLERLLGENTVFYDEYFPGELAQLSLDTLLQNIYAKRATVVVVVVGADYQRKEWCGLEFRAIKELIMAKEDRRVMLVRTDDGEVDGIFKTDGFIDARRFSPVEIADMVARRVAEFRGVP
jgi:hypothetical protein